MNGKVLNGKVLAIASHVRVHGTSASRGTHQRPADGRPVHDPAFRVVPARDDHGRQQLLVVVVHRLDQLRDRRDARLGPNLCARRRGMMRRDPGPPCGVWEHAAYCRSTHPSYADPQTSGRTR